MILVARTEDEKLAMAKWFSEHIGIANFFTGQEFQIIGFARPGKGFCGAVVFQNYRYPDIEMSGVGATGWLTRAHIRELCEYTFLELNCLRVTAMTSRSNKQAKKLLWRLGFKLEGVSRQKMPDGSDGFIFGLIKDECKWLKGN